MSQRYYRNCCRNFGSLRDLKPSTDRPLRSSFLEYQFRYFACPFSWWLCVFLLIVCGLLFSLVTWPESRLFFPAILPHFMEIQKTSRRGAGTGQSLRRHLLRTRRPGARVPRQSQTWRVQPQTKQTKLCSADLKGTSKWRVFTAAGGRGGGQRWSWPTASGELRGAFPPS